MPRIRTVVFSFCRPPGGAHRSTTWLPHYSARRRSYARTSSDQTAFTSHHLLGGHHLLDPNASSGRADCRSRSSASSAASRRTVPSSARAVQVRGGDRGHPSAGAVGQDDLRESISAGKQGCAPISNTNFRHYFPMPRHTQYCAAEKYIASIASGVAVCWVDTGPGFGQPRNQHPGIPSPGC
jgi:hypothetical protein